MTTDATIFFVKHCPFIIRLYQLKSNQVFVGDGMVQNSRGQKGDIISHANFALQKLRHPILYLKENSVQYQKNAKEGLLERRIHH